MTKGLLYFIFTTVEKIHQKDILIETPAIAVSAKVPRQDAAVVS